MKAQLERGHMRANHVERLSNHQSLARGLEPILADSPRGRAQRLEFAHSWANLAAVNVMRGAAQLGVIVVTCTRNRSLRLESR